MGPLRSGKSGQLSPEISMFGSSPRCVWDPYSSHSAWRWPPGWFATPSRSQGTVFFWGGNPSKERGTIHLLLVWGKPENSKMPKLNHPSFWFLITKQLWHRKEAGSRVHQSTYISSIPPFPLPVEQHHHQPTWPSTPNDPRIHQESKASKFWSLGTCMSFLFFSSPCMDAHSSMQKLDILGRNPFCFVRSQWTPNAPL